LWSTVCMGRHHVTCLQCPLPYKFLREKPRTMYDVRCCEILNGQALKACSWSDGDIGQLHTMLDKVQETLDDAKNIVRNKHSDASNGT